ncbi:hypothetical protein D9M68_850770 [compost metagenome]
MRVQRRRVGVGGVADAGDTGDARLGAAGVVKEQLFADLHAAQEIARLVIAYPVPAGLAEALQVVDGELVGF